VLKAHHRRGDRDAALALDRHTIRAHPPPLAPRLDRACQLDRPPNSTISRSKWSCQTLECEMIAKMHRRNLVRQGAHQSTLTVTGTQAAAGKRSRCVGAERVYVERRRFCQCLTYGNVFYAERCSLPREDILTG